MRVLIACEYSGTVRDAFIDLGHDAISCDLLPTDKQGPHYVGDVMDIIGDGWDLMIAHPPCTFLTIAAEWAYNETQTKKIKPGTLIGRERERARSESLEFICKLWNAPIKKICIENPVGVINSRLPFMPKPQIIQPYDFGDDASKKTCLWLKNLPDLVQTEYIKPRLVCCGAVVPDELGKYGCPNFCGDNIARPRWGNQTNSGQNNLGPSDDRWKIRSQTYKGIAQAFANQWGGHDIIESQKTEAICPQHSTERSTLF